MLSQLERDKNRKNPSVPQEQEPFGMNPFQSRASFAEFDLKPGQIKKESAKSSLSVPMARHSFPQRIRTALYRKKAVHSTSRKLMHQKSFLSFSWTSMLFQKIKNFFH